jgi:hypothetical protein
VTAAAAVDGYSIVTTALPANVNAAAVILENAPRVDDDRADALDLGLTGAHRVTAADGTLEPARIIVAGGRTVAVYAIAPDGADAVRVTVATGEHLHLSGVIGGIAGADALTDALRRRDISAVLSVLVGVPDGAARLRWIPPPAPVPPPGTGPPPATGSTAAPQAGRQIGEA